MPIIINRALLTTALFSWVWLFQAASYLERTGINMKFWAILGRLPASRWESFLAQGAQLQNNRHQALLVMETGESAAGVLILRETELDKCEVFVFRKEMILFVTDLTFSNICATRLYGNTHCCVATGRTSSFCCWNLHCACQSACQCIIW